MYYIGSIYYRKSLGIIYDLAIRGVLILHLRNSNPILEIVYSFNGMKVKGRGEREKERVSR